MYTNPGTDKFPHGFPHYWESSKQDKTHGERLKIGIEIACVHGSRPRIFVSYEDVASDPNLTCEVLYRVLRAEQEERGKLPDKLYLQFDNCIRENKNTMVFAYCCWLVERGIFKQIFISFLPVGHTHFDCDALASRLGLITKWQDVTDIDEFCRKLEQCNSPSPHVELVRSVMDIKGLFNPTGEATCPVASSIVRRNNGMCTKVDGSRQQMQYMHKTSPLHWYIGPDVHGDIFIQSKLTCEDEHWSAQHYPWTTAPRPGNRISKENTSGLRPSDIKICPQKKIMATRANELKNSLTHAKCRLSGPEWEKVKEIWDALMTDRGLETSVVPNGGLFQGEIDDPDEQEQAVQQHAEERTMHIRPPSRIFHNTSLQAIDRENRKRRGRATAELVIGNLVAITGNYEPTTPDESKHDFWTGKITNLDYDSRMVQIQYYNTGVRKCLDIARATYRVWTGPDRLDWVDISRVLHTWETFTEGMRIAAPERRSIKIALLLPPEHVDAESSNDVE